MDDDVRKYNRNIRVNNNLIDDEFELPEDRITEQEFNDRSMENGPVQEEGFLKRLLGLSRYDQYNKEIDDKLKYKNYMDINKLGIQRNEEYRDAGVPISKYKEDYKQGSPLNLQDKAQSDRRFQSLIDSYKLQGK